MLVRGEVAFPCNTIWIPRVKVCFFYWGLGKNSIFSIKSFYEKMSFRELEG